MCRSFATFLVLWAVVLAAVVLLGIERAAFRSAADGREVVAHLRAHWAARAGVEATIAQLAFNTVSPDYSSAYTVEDDMAGVSHGAIMSDGQVTAGDGGSSFARGSRGGRSRVEATWSITHTRFPLTVDGPIDEHAKLNISSLTAADWALVPYTDPGMIDAILDWIDADEDANPFGAEVGQYLSMRYPYEPRNARARTLEELELVRDVLPEYVRNEDTNLDSRLDPNEDDGSMSYPRDNADGRLDAGWSRYLTARSARLQYGGLGVSGRPRLNLVTAEASDVQQRLGVDATQAQVIVAHGAAGTTLADFISTNLTQLAQADGVQLRSPPAELTNDQLALLLEECEIAEVDESEGEDTEAPGPTLPGKVNINTVDEQTLEYLAQIGPAMADAIIYERNSRSQGFTSMVDLLDIPSVSRSTLASLYELFDVRSNVYTIVCRGRDEATGAEVEISATVDRSTLPITITDLLVR